MKEDILEQLSDDWLQSKGYFTRHNLKFKPKASAPGFELRQDSVASDIDVVGLHPALEGCDRVVVVSCKSWQAGFDPKAKLSQIERDMRVGGREAWRGFRELVQPKWAQAFLEAVENATGSRTFTYVTAVTRLNGDRAVWESCAGFHSALEGNPIRIVTLAEMAGDVAGALTTTVAASHFGRTLQLLKASGFLSGNTAR